MDITQLPSFHRRLTSHLRRRCLGMVADQVLRSMLAMYPVGYTELAVVTRYLSRLAPPYVSKPQNHLKSTTSNTMHMSRVPHELHFIYHFISFHIISYVAIEVEKKQTWYSVRNNMVLLLVCLAEERRGSADGSVGDRLV